VLRAPQHECAGTVPAILPKAHEKVRALLAGYRKPEGREQQLPKMRAVVERARRELVG
jgi:hypothetical protein